MISFILGLRHKFFRLLLGKLCLCLQKLIAKRLRVCEVAHFQGSTGNGLIENGFQNAVILGVKEGMSNKVTHNFVNYSHPHVESA